MRRSGNNYTETRLLYLTAASLTFDDNTTDDPPLTGTYNTCGATRYQLCTDFTGGSLHAYWNYFVGEQLYTEYAHLEDPNVSWQAYQAAYSNLPTKPMCEYTRGVSYPCFGDGRGGESSEGSWYQYSMYRLRYALNIAHTAGYDDPMLYGPQMSLGTSSWWDMKYVSDLSFLTGFSAANGPQGAGSALPAYNYFTTGDSEAYYRSLVDFAPEAALMTFDTYMGRTDRTNALEWGVLNSAFGGAVGVGCTGPSCGFDASIGNVFISGTAPMDAFIALPATDPVDNLPSDPRPSFPTDLYNGSFNQHVMVRNNWTQGGNTILSTYCPNTLNDHEGQLCGRFDLLSNNEYITKGRVVFNDYNEMMAVSTQSNEASIANSGSTWCSSTLLADWAVCNLWGYEARNGGEFSHGEQAGLLQQFQHSELPAYAAVIANTTDDYNGWWQYKCGSPYLCYNDVTAASRSLIYLRETNQIVYYDRATTGHSASKAVYQNATGALSISGNTASWLTRSAQQIVYFTSLLPSGATVSDVGLSTVNVSSVQTEDWEPYTTVEVSAGTPLSTQFLSVMQWGESSFTPSITSLIQSTSGTNFDGALIDSSVVMFMRTWPATLTGVTYPASGGTTQYVSDLTPNETYSITGDGTPSSATTDAAGVLVFSSSGTGNIRIGTGTVSLTSITVTPSSLSLEVGGTQQYTATCNYSDSSSVNCTPAVTWTSSATGVVTISGSGLATGVAQGNANVIATNDSIQGQTAVTINLTQAATPSFSPAAGTYSSAQTVTISTTTPSATIYYTTNRSTPTTGSAVYSGPITVSATETVEAIAVASGYSTSATGSATYTIKLTQAATPTFSPAAGTYSSAQAVTISSATPGATIYYTTNGFTPTTNSMVYSGPITVSSTETVEAIAVATGYSTSAAGSATYTIKLKQAATPTFSPGAGTYSSAQTVTVSTTTPSATIYYTTNGSTPTTGSAVYSGPITVSATETVEAIAVASGYSTSAIGSATYTINLAQAATPTFSPGAGTYSSAQTVTISTTTPGATIYYTTNGSTPTTNSTVYSGPITVSATETVEAIAVAAGSSIIESIATATVNSSQSAVGSAAYTMILPTPSFSVAVSPGSLAVTAGQSGTTTVLVTPQNSFAATVSFSCSGLPSGASCSFSPATVIPSGGVASTTLTVTTSTTDAALHRNPSPLFPGSVLAVTLCCFGWKKRRGLQLLPLVLIALGLSLCIGCGAIVGVRSTSQATTQATSSTVTVIATGGSLQPTASFTLTVQ
jgi:hypothetical protein